MQIRKKITLVFLVLVAALLGASFASVYYLSASSRKEAYYERLENRARTTARLLIEVEEVDADLLLIIDRSTPGILPFEQVAVFNSRDELIYHTGEAGGMRLSSGQLDEIDREGEMRFQYGELEALGLRYEHPEGRFIVVAMAQDFYALQRLKQLLFILSGVFVVGIGIAAAAGWFYSGRVLSPIARVIQEVRGIEATNLHARLNEGKEQDEIAQLAHTFNELLDRLQASFSMQQEFIANASHELRTPLTAIIGQLEVAGLRPRSTGEYQEVLRSVLEDMRRLQSLSNRLMLLAHASSELPRHRFGPVRIDEVIWQVRQDLVRLRPDYRIEVVFEHEPEEGDELTLQGHEQLLYAAISNLAENGCKYSPDHKVTITVGAGPAEITLSFSNTVSQAIPVSELQQFFEPFFRGAQAHGIPGNGLGLPLAQRIAQLHEGSLWVSQPEPSHVVFGFKIHSSGSA